ncbi:MAG: heavy-metal-associated domain-containing protein [Ruminococcus sp.]|nr:heavy-metal-associated domain-containing protein [Ruminococcus sp.]
MKKLAHGCCGTGGDDEKAPETKADISEYKYKYTVKVGGMSCKNCAAKIENTFSRKDGLYAKADFKNGTAEIYSNADVSEFTIRQTVVGLGYSVEKIEKNDFQ